eukprot:m.133231 g.133231  ORF g.133231 m.133231 type:complete len:106 (-) comp14823_c1_seq5:1720-2037(-)
MEGALTLATGSCSFTFSFFFFLFFPEPSLLADFASATTTLSFDAAALSLSSLSCFSALFLRFFDFESTDTPTLEARGAACRAVASSELGSKSQSGTSIAVIQVKF